MPSFDIVSEIDFHEITNAIDQANREVDTRFDLKGTNAQFLLEKESIKMTADNDFHLTQLLDILKKKLAKRNIDLRHIKVEEPVIQLNKADQEVVLQQGLSADLAKKIVKLIKDQKTKVQPSIQGDKVRVTAKSKDDLQGIMAFLRRQELDLPLQFNNFRD